MNQKTRRLCPKSLLDKATKFITFIPYCCCLLRYTTILYLDILSKVNASYGDFKQQNFFFNLKNSHFTKSF